MKNILLVDDDHICNFLSKKALQQIGYVSEIYVALNGKEALGFFNEFENPHSLPDIILLDLNMPVMDGFGFLEAFKKLSIPEKENIKIIVVTSSNDPNDVARAKTFGINQYLTKPINENALLAALSLIE
jgi:CheY-like chemotaxis protein